MDRLRFYIPCSSVVGRRAEERLSAPENSERTEEEADLIVTQK